MAELKELNKAQRWEVIKEIISEHAIGTQMELAEHLREKGVEITQGTLSRDMTEMKLVKVKKGNKTYAYELPKSPAVPDATDHFFQFFKTSVTSVDSALNQVVIHTYVGMAQAVCATIDGMHFQNILGTIAGDDTILIITKNEESALQVTTSLKTYLQK